MKKYDICGLGNTLIDFLVNVSDQKLTDLELKKGVFHLLESDKVHDYIDRFNPKVVPAGAVANTLMGMAYLGSRCILIGKVGSGKYGDMYEEIITKEGVTPHLVRSKSKRTGKVLSFVTPDAERTFGVHLGAAVSLGKDSIIDEDIISSKYLYFTGYELESITESVRHSVSVAKKNNVKIAMDLADPELIKRNMEKIKSIMKELDVIFMNEDEALSLTGFVPDDAAKEISKYVGIVVVKMGKSGSIVVSNKEVYKIKPIKVKAVDTTGAGDLYAAGFLHVLINGKSLEDAGNLGSVMGAKIVSQVGAMLSDTAKEEIQEMI